jgi:hypothetical protein
MNQYNHKGGRGYKLPYSTKPVRVPEKLIPIIEELTNLLETYPDQEINLLLIDANKLVSDISRRERGYRSNSAGELIKKIKDGKILSTKQ